VLAAPFSVAVPIFSTIYGGATTYGAVPTYPAATPAAQITTTTQPASSLDSISDAALDKLIDRIEKRIQTRQATQPVQAPPPVKTSLAPQELNQQAAQILANSCAKCHTGAGAKGGQTMFTAEGNTLYMSGDLDKAKIVQAIASGKMPKIDPTYHAPAVTAENLELLRQWSKLG